MTFGSVGKLMLPRVIAYFDKNLFYTTFKINEVDQKIKNLAQP